MIHYCIKYRGIEWNDNRPSQIACLGGNHPKIHSDINMAYQYLEKHHHSWKFGTYKFWVEEYVEHLITRDEVRVQQQRAIWEIQVAEDEHFCEALDKAAKGI